MKITYDEVNRRIEKYSEIAYIVMVKVSPVLLVLPKFVVAMFVYYTTDEGDEALELPFPLWSVNKIFENFHVQR